MASLLHRSADAHPTRSVQPSKAGALKVQYSTIPERQFGTGDRCAGSGRLDEPRRGRRSHHAVIVFANVVGYSRLMADDEPGTLNRWSALYKNALKPEAERRRGRLKPEFRPATFDAGASLSGSPRLAQLTWKGCAQQACRTEERRGQSWLSSVASQNQASPENPASRASRA